MLDRDLAALYEVDTKVFNQAVKRNIKRFPSGFMFQLSKAEWESLKLPERSMDEPLRSQTVTLNSGRGQHVKYLPFAFTDQGVAMLSGILNSDKAVQMNIAIMRAFVEIRRIIFRQSDLKTQLFEIKQRMGEHDAQLNQIYDALENLLDEKAAPTQMGGARQNWFQEPGNLYIQSHYRSEYTVLFHDLPAGSVTCT